MKFFLHILCFGLSFFVFSGDARAVMNGDSSAKQAYIVDYDTGTTLFAKNEDQRMPTSSMSKVMTMYLIFEALQNGSLSLDTEFPVSEKAWRKGGSKMFVDVGSTIKIEDLIRGVIIQSGNDATIVLAEGLAGTEAAFADALNEKARALGMENSHFMNASGWPDPEHYSTAQDLAIMARAMIENFPEYYPFYSEKEFSYNNIRQPNRNPLLFRNIGADGLKTGHTEDGGYGLIGSGLSKDGRRVVMVLNGLESEKERASESARLLDWALRSFENVSLFDAGENVAPAPVVLGKQDSVSLQIEEKLWLTVPKAVKNSLDVKAVFNSPVIAPVQKGDVLGTLVVEIPRGDILEFPLVASENIEKQGFLSATFSKIKMKLAGQSE